MLTAGSDLEVATFPIGGSVGPDALLEDLSIPARLDQGAAYRMRVVARSAKPGTGKIRFYRNDRYIGDREVTLTGGRADVLEIPQVAEKPGLYRYRAVLEMDDESVDSIPQNNVVPHCFAGWSPPIRRPFRAPPGSGTSLAFRPLGGFLRHPHVPQ